MFFFFSRIFFFFQHSRIQSGFQPPVNVQETFSGKNVEREHREMKLCDNREQDIWLIEPDLICVFVFRDGKSSMIYTVIINMLVFVLGLSRGTW